MPTYIQKDITSDLDSITKDNTALFTDTEMSAGTGVDTSRSASVPSLSLRSYACILPAGKPNSDVMESGGTQTYEMEVILGGMLLTARVRIGRVSPTGTVLQVGAYTGTQTTQASRVFSPVAPTWTGGQEACGNRLFIEVELDNTDTMMALTFELGLGTTANEVITDITEDGGSCGGGGIGVPEFMTVFRNQEQNLKIQLTIKRNSQRRFEALRKKILQPERYTTWASVITVAVGRTFNIRHDISEFVNRTFNIRHDILILVGRTFNIRHDIAELVGRIFNLRHDLAGAVGRTFNIRHDISEFVNRTFNIRHDILILVGRTFTVRHDIEILVGRTFNVRHDIEILVGRTFNVRHDISELVGRTFNLRHDIILTSTFKITGVTYKGDGTATILGTVVCRLHKDNLDNTSTFVAEVISNAVTGVYEFLGIVDDDPQYYVTGWKDDSSNEYDMTDHILKPEAE